MIPNMNFWHVGYAIQLEACYCYMSLGYRTEGSREFQCARLLKHHWGPKVCGAHWTST